jgi:flagellar basal-body rod protein FlgC
VGLGPVATDPGDFHARYEPGHPSADASGMVRYPNVNTMVELSDMRDAQRSYEANLNVVTATRRMLLRTISILSG